MDGALKQMFRDLVFLCSISNKSTCYREIDAYLKRLQTSLSEENSTIGKKYWTIMAMEQFLIVDKNQQRCALEILEKCLEYDQSPIIGDILCITISCIRDSRAGDILLRTLNVCLNLIFNF